MVKIIVHNLRYCWENKYNNYSWNVFFIFTLNLILWIKNFTLLLNKLFSIPGRKSYILVLWLIWPTIECMELHAILWFTKIKCDNEIWIDYNLIPMKTMDYSIPGQKLTRKIYYIILPVKHFACKHIYYDTYVSMHKELIKRYFEHILRFEWHYDFVG